MVNGFSVRRACFFLFFFFMCTGFLAGDLAYFTRYVCSVL